MARALPDDWDIEIIQAASGEACLELLRQRPSDILFLDLNMPGLDGYQVLEAIRTEDLKTMTIVVSGDIQPEARERVQKLGAMEFIKKPISVEILTQVLDEYGLLSMFRGAAGQARHSDAIEVDIRDGYREVTNISMGRATDLLARYLNTFIAMPEPNISTVEISDVQMILRELDNTQKVSSLCQGFIAPDIAGEAMLLFRDPDFEQIASDLELDYGENSNIELEIQMEIASILFGAFIGGMRDQFKTCFSQGQPILLGQHITLNELQDKLRNKWQKSLCIEMSYFIEKYQLNCDLIIFFAESSISELDHKVRQLIA
jgi:chemotaxis protein CheY-P-specific phosphatase CheC/CheY-like chemotaxis protein